MCDQRQFCIYLVSNCIRFRYSVPYFITSDA